MEGKGERSKGCDMEEKKLWSRFKIKDSSRGRCPDENLLAAYIDHTLTKSEKKEVERHLLTCPSCLNAIIEIGQALGMPQKEGLKEKDLEGIFELVPEGPGVIEAVLERIREFLTKRAVPAPCFALSVFLVCAVGFYAGSQTWFEQEFFKKKIVAELIFSFDSTVTDYHFSGDKG